MKGLKIIPMFVALLFFTYLGVVFVRYNSEEVVVRFWRSESPSTALGFVILTSILVGMVLAGILCSIELLFLYVQNQKLKRRLRSLEGPSPHSTFDNAVKITFDEKDGEIFSNDDEITGEMRPGKQTDSADSGP